MDPRADTHPEQSWNLSRGDAITPELTAMRLLGGGSTYEALLAFDEITYGPVVVKLVRPHEVTDEETLANLDREALALDVANHPVVVRGLRHEAAGPRPHLVLEFIEGPSLARLIRRHGRLSEQQYLPLAIEVASALHYFGHQDVVHLDIKPSNIIMGSPARLIDFSVARPAHRAAEITGLIGTDAYMAPEQADPGGRYGVPGHASDVWGLGATLFHAITGNRPFATGDPDAATPEERHPQLTYAHGELPGGLPVGVADLVSAMLEPEPVHRPRPRDIVDELEPALASLPAPKALSFKVR